MVRLQRGGGYRGPGLCLFCSLFRPAHRDQGQVSPLLHRCPLVPVPRLTLRVARGLPLLTSVWAEFACGAWSQPCSPGA